MARSKGKHHLNWKKQIFTADHCQTVASSIQVAHPFSWFAEFWQNVCQACLCCLLTRDFVVRWQRVVCVFLLHPHPYLPTVCLTVLSLYPSRHASEMSSNSSLGEMPTQQAVVQSFLKNYEKVCLFITVRE